MVEPSSLIAFAGVSVLLMIIPGPNAALIVGTSLASGVRAGLVTVAGTSSAGALLLLLTGAGLTALLQAAAAWIDWVRWLRAAYLVWIGIWQWCAAGALAERPAPPAVSRGILYLKGAALSLSNPKTLVFYAAFLPQFVDVTRPIGPQLFELSVVFLLLAIVLDTGWALLAARLRPLLRRRPILHGRISGGLMIGAGVGLALVHRA